MSTQAGPMTRMAGFPGGHGARGDDSKGHMESGNAEAMPGMGGMDMAGMNMGSMPMAAASSDSKVPAAALAGGREATAPDGALANTHLDAGMMGMMQERDKPVLTLSAEQRRNLNAFDMSQSSMKAQNEETAPNANNVPNFPQDNYMEGPMMNMDALVNKPENLGLRPYWSRWMQGMMTFVRVLPPAEYAQVVSAMRGADRPRDPYASLYVPPADTGRRRG